MIDALAGTTAAGKGAELLQSDKDLREHFAVVCGIRESIAPFVERTQAPEAPVIKALANVEHLFTPIRATLKPGVQALAVARALHPTPAVSGTPKQFSIEWLRQHEGFARGWYAGAVGTIGVHGVTLAVALRSVLLDGARARLFVGAGVVQGSTADAEWNETERKSWAVLGGAR
jgi:salicylate biosynthesis isochorismate synthase/menaquinone-specific isochorismate synthase